MRDKSVKYKQPLKESFLEDILDMSDEELKAELKSRNLNADNLVQRFNSALWKGTELAKRRLEVHMRESRARSHDVSISIPHIRTARQPTEVSTHHSKRWSTTTWTNQSAMKLAQTREPAQVIVELARNAVAQAMDSGWSGPPYDPIKLGKILGLKVVPSADVRDARTLPDRGSGFTIEFNPNQPERRLRYSIAHEIAHTFFPDCRENVRHRHSRDEMKGDEWQLEALCNIAAAELLMPIGSLEPLDRGGFNIDKLLGLRDKFQVSTEAMFIRAVNTSTLPVAMFCAHRSERPGVSGYEIDYLIRSSSLSSTAIPQSFANNDTVTECTAIGYTSKGSIRIGNQTLRLECVGMPPYPGSTFPRVAGVLAPSGAIASQKKLLSYVVGNVLEPRGTGPKIVGHVVNNKTSNWGGRGVAIAIKNRWPTSQDDFKKWSSERRLSEALGDVCLTKIDDQLYIASMIAQVGYGPSSGPRLRYGALHSCLEKLASEAAALGASVHLPRIGVGQAGGRWPVVEELLKLTMSEIDVRTTIYDLPGRSKLPLQQEIDLSR